LSIKWVRRRVGTVGLRIGQIGKGTGERFRSAEEEDGAAAKKPEDTENAERGNRKVA